MKILPVLAAFLISCAPFGANADTRTEPGAFVDVSVGGAAWAIDDQSLTANEIGDGDGDGAVKINAGYWMNKTWGVAVSHVDHGDFTQKFDTGTLKGSATSTAVSLLGRVPLGQRWTLVGKVNVTHADMKDNGSTGGNGEFKKLIGDDTSLILPGVEVNYLLNDRASLFLEAEPRGQAADELSIGYVGAGVRVRF